MSTLSKRERVEVALRGDPIDRVPVSAWRHFIEAERDPVTLAAASLDHFHHFDWDWLKVNPRATLYAEAWGAQYNFAQYDSVLPELIDTPLHTPADLEKIVPLNPTAGVFAEHLELTRQGRSRDRRCTLFANRLFAAVRAELSRSTSAHGQNR